MNIELRRQMQRYGAVAYLITIGEGRPHAVSVMLAWADEVLTTGAGTRTAANIGGGADVTLLWPPPPGEDYSLIVDGDAVVRPGPDGPQVVVRPRAAVRHRLAAAPPGTGAGDVPGCEPVPVEPVPVAAPSGREAHEVVAGVEPQP